MTTAVDQTPLDVQRYVQDLTQRRLGVEVFCAAMRAVHQERAAERALRECSEQNDQVTAALHRLVPGS